MKLEEIFDEYILKSEQITTVKRSIKEIARNELSRLEQEGEEEEKKGRKNTTISIDFFFIHDPKTGELIRYKHTSRTIEEKKKQIYLLKNRQYQWILSESYEIFKDYIIKIYAFLGYQDINVWPLKDYGNVVFYELADKDYLFFLNQAKIKKDVPDSILNTLRKFLPEYKNLETNNRLNKNLKFEINIIEHFRHLIVHCGGKTSDKESLAKKILEKSGLWNNGKNNEENRNLILSFFRLKESDDIILVETNVNNDPNGPYIDNLDNLISSLNTVAHIIFNELINYKIPEEEQTETDDN